MDIETIHSNNYSQKYENNSIHVVDKLPGNPSLYN